MDAQSDISAVSEPVPLGGALPEELEFYRSYEWCLNPYLTVSEAIDHLREELDKLSVAPKGWRSGEVATNIFLLSCGLLNGVDEYQRGVSLRLPRRLAATAFGRGAGWLVQTISDRPWSRRRLELWRQRWLSSVNDFLSLVVGGQDIDAERLVESGRALKGVLESTLPADLQAQRLGVPIPFRRLDLTQKDVLALGEIFARRFPEPTQPILLLGLRTAGSYFAPLLKAFFAARGYENVALLTVEPTKGVGRKENSELRRFAARGYWALIVDDAPQTSRTVLAGFDIAQRAGFAPRDVKFVAPTHPAKPGWFKTLPEDSVVTLPPERWHKQELMNPKAVELRLAEYFRSRNFARVSVAASRGADERNAALQGAASDERGVRLKRVFEVLLETQEGEKQTKYVLAKSVGWGWLGYHAFLIGRRLGEHVPPVLGLRDGILYTEWLPPLGPESGVGRNVLVDSAASYVAARTRRVNLGGSAAAMDLKKHDNGRRVLQQTLSRAYGRFPADRLMQSRLGEWLRKQPCPSPTHIDGDMHRSEWVLGPHGPLKTDYEHHGMGRSALNVVDPAYDLADTMLNLALSPQEERELMERYIAESGDAAVEQRLFLHKLLAGLWAMSQSQDQLFDSARGADGQRALHRRFMNAWDFLTIQTARHCGSLCRTSADRRWRAPLVVLDVDGVIDRRLFGFPCTTAAGVKALSLLNAHGYSVALNTARSVAEVKGYCEAYSLAGGVAEYGSYLWDAVHERGRVLISAEAERQLAQLRTSLQRVPGVFLDERHQYSIRAFTYRAKPQGLMHALIGSAHASSIGDGAMAPISIHIAHQLLEDLRLDRLGFRQTALDTAIVAKEVDKGGGLVALRDWVLAPDAETIAVGDDEPDLAMFRVATRSFAPANLGCRPQARLLGCQIVASPYQRGLLDIVRRIIHADNQRCPQCADAQSGSSLNEELFFRLLQAADEPWRANLKRAMFHPAAFRAFIN